MKKQEARSKKWALGMVVAVVAAATLMGAEIGAQVQPPAGAGFPATTNTKRDREKLVVSAERLEKPDLTYCLLPRFEDMRAGNAAIKYLNAVGQGPRLTDDELGLIDRSLEMPLENLQESNPSLKEMLDKHPTSFLREGALCETVDWQPDLRENGFDTLIPWVGNLRQLANVLAVRVRLDIKRHDWVAARDKLQTGYALARHLGQGETLIESLVGIAVAGRMNQCLEDWVGEPGAPNLYWPLTNLPAPFDDLRRGMNAEQGLLYFAIPEFKRMRDGEYSPEVWIGLVNRFFKVTHTIGYPESAWDGLTGGTTPSPWQRQINGTLAAMVVYPEAKRYFHERGMTDVEVEKMPVAEAIGRYIVESYEKDRDNLFKYMGLPLAQRVEGLKSFANEFEKRSEVPAGEVMARTLLPSISRAVLISAKLDGQIAALRIVEAVRAYAAETGALPENLGALKLPVPVDAMGNAFEYQKNGDVAVLTAPMQKGESDNGTYEIRLRK